MNETTTTSDRAPVSRRQIIKAGAAAATAGALSLGPTGVGAASGPGRKTFLFVHGAWHSAAHWNGVAAHLVAMVHRVSAIDLPGSGLNARYPSSYLRNDAAALATEVSPIACVHLEDYRKAVAEQVTHWRAAATR
jgi:pimeloyl-ACP methyl ester carboxylesterase